MNIPCTNCGKILTVPDIPLPEDYTQRCTSCGHINHISDEAPAPDLDWDTLENTASGTFASLSMQSESSHAVDQNGLQQLQKSLARDFEQRLRDIETQLRAEIGELVRAQDKGPSAFQREVAKHVVEHTALIGAGNDQMIGHCRKVAGELGFQVTDTKNLEQTYKAITQKPYHLMILDQAYLKSGESGKQIMRYIKRTPLSVRRCQTVVLISGGIPSGEPQVFYQWGFDFNLHPRDLDKLGKHLKVVLQLKDELLTPYLV